MTKNEKELRLQGVVGWLVTFTFSTFLFLGVSKLRWGLWAFFFGYVSVASAYNAHKSWFGYRDDEEDEEYEYEEDDS